MVKMVLLDSKTMECITTLGRKSGENGKSIKAKVRRHVVLHVNGQCYLNVSYIKYNIPPGEYHPYSPLVQSKLPLAF